MIESEPLTIDPKVQHPLDNDSSTRYSYFSKNFISGETPKIQAQSQIHYRCRILRIFTKPSAIEWYSHLRMRLGGVDDAYRDKRDVITKYPHLLL